MLIVNDLSVTTHLGRTLIDHLSFTLNPREKIALIGEEGNGKSTLLKLLADPQSVSDYVEVHGHIDTRHALIGYLPQHLPAFWQTCTVMEYLLKKQPQEDWPEHRYSMEEEYAVLAAQMHLSVSLLQEERPIATLSGGEKVKIQLLKLLYTTPDLWLLDEPTNDLDLSTLRWLENFLLSRNEPILFVSHDEELLDKVATGIIHFEQLKRKTAASNTVSKIPYAQYVETRQNYLRKETQLAIKEKEEKDKQMERWRKIYQSVQYQQNTVSRQDPHHAQMLKKKMHSIKAMKRRIDEEKVRHAPDPEEAIRLRFEPVDLPASRLILDYEEEALCVNERVLARHLSLCIKGPAHVILIGDNGTGKTTLLKAIYQQLRDSSLSVGYMPQNYAELLTQSDTPLQFLTPHPDHTTLSRIRSYLGCLKFTADEMEQPIRFLSGGQQAKLLLLKLVYDAPQVLLLDEPTRNLSPLSGPIIRQMLQEYQGCIIAISHDRRFIKEVGDTVYQLQKEGLFPLHHFEG